MKKVMIGILIIIPIIIVITVGAVTTFVTTRTHIAVDSVEFDRDSLYVEFGQEFVDLSQLLAISILPEKARNKEVTWSIADITCFDADYQEKWKNGEAEDPVFFVDGDKRVKNSLTGKIRVTCPCAFYVYAQAEQMSDKCYVSISSELSAIKVTGADRVAVGECARLAIESYPVDSRYDDAVWRASNDNVIVDANGIIYGNRAGTATVTATVTVGDRQIESESYQLTITPSATLLGNQIVTSQNSILYSKLGVDKSQITNYFGMTLGDERIILDEAHDVAPKFLAGGEEVRIVRCDADDVVIRFAQLFDLNSGCVIAKGERITLKAVWADQLKDGEPTVEWMSSNDNILSVDDGVVSAKQRGVATITATCGDNTTTIVLAIEEKISSLVLNVTDSSQEKSGGLAREYVFASGRYADVETGEIEDNSFAITFAYPVMPETEDEMLAFVKSYDFAVKQLVLGDDGEYEAVNTDKAYFVDNVLYFDDDKITDDDGKVLLQVSVSAKFPLYENLRSYTQKQVVIKVVKGVVACDQAQLCRAGEDKLNVCLGADIYAVNPKRQEPVFALYGSMFGNNFKVSSSSDQVYKRAMEFLAFYGDGITISNVRVTLNSDMPENITNNVDELMGINGFAVGLRGEGSYLGEEDKNHKVMLEYTIVENCRIAVQCYNVDVTINGCILRNTIEMAIWSPTSFTYWGTEGYVYGQAMYSHVTVKNSITSNSIGTAFSFQFVNYENYSSPHEVLIHGEVCSKENVLQAIEEGKCSSLEIIGFFDVYNWYKLNVLDIISSFSIAEIEAIKDILNMVVKDELATNDMFARFRKTYEKQDYFHLGGIAVGFNEGKYLKVGRIDDERWGYFSSEDFTGVLSILGSAGLNIDVWCYTEDTEDLLPDATYVINEKLKDKLHGVGVKYPKGTPEYEQANAN